MPVSRGDMYNTHVYYFLLPHSHVIFAIIAQNSSGFKMHGNLAKLKGSVQRSVGTDSPKRLHVLLEPELVLQKEECILSYSFSLI